MCAYVTPIRAPATAATPALRFVFAGQFIGVALARRAIRFARRRDVWPTSRCCCLVSLSLLRAARAMKYRGGNRAPIIHFGSDASRPNQLLQSGAD
jgi:hypothetical protein